MADKPEAAEEEGEEKKGGKLKLVIIGLAGLLLVGGGGGAAAWFLGLFGGSEIRAAEGEAHEGEPAVSAGEEAGSHAADGEADGAPGEHGTAPVSVAFVELPDVLVNLQSSGKRMRYLKLALALEVSDEEAVEPLRALTPRIMDSVQLYLRALRVDDVRGAIGMERLKEEMAARINRAVAPLRVEGVLIKEMLVQ